jgi:hypothetical protein
MEQHKEELGRKIFCIALPKRYGPDIVRLMVRNEYEVYSLENEAYLDTVLREYPGSVRVVFDRNAIVLHTGEEGAASSGGMAVDISGGLTPPAEAAIIDKLESLRARGQRQYVRFGGTDNVNVAFTFAAGGREYSGYVYDISSAGMSCAFDKDTQLPLNTFIGRINLTLEGETYAITGKTLLQRRLDSEKRLFVLMFDRRMPENIREVLQDFIHSSLQAKMLAKLDRAE